MLDVIDSASMRKARGAFFTPPEISRYMAGWAIRTPTDRVLEPSVGDAAFLLEAVNRLKSLGVGRPTVEGVEIHAPSAARADFRLTEVGAYPRIRVSDFFDVDSDPTYDVVIGNPPYIRYHDFSGEARAKARRAALHAGVGLSGLASSWAAFVAHSTTFLSRGGRLAFVLPAELLSVNYAAPIRGLLFERFREVDLVLFTERVFPEAEADVVLLLADGFGEGPTDHARVRQVHDADALRAPSRAVEWTPTDPFAKWTSSLLNDDAAEMYSTLTQSGQFVGLAAWGRTSLGAVTGNNSFFALSDSDLAANRLSQADVVRLSPPGSRHLRGISFGRAELRKAAATGKRVWLFKPGDDPSRTARLYIRRGEDAGVDQAYKCRVRTPWWEVPLGPRADLFLTYMNADAPRISRNAAGVHHLNSVHGVNLRAEYRRLGQQLLAIASLSSVTLLGAELVGRAYGGGMLKLEPREADALPVPSPDLLAQSATELIGVAGEVRWLLQSGDVMAASAVVDRILFGALGANEVAPALLRDARAQYLARRVARANFKSSSSPH